MNWLACILTVVIVYSVGKELFEAGEKIKFSILIWKQTRIHTVAIALVTLFLMITVCQYISDVFPFLNKISWIYLFSGGDVYNINIGAPLHIGLNTNNVSFKLFYGIFLIGVLVLLPHWALWEEDIFRRGKNSYKKIIISSILFGLCHMIAGVSLTIAIALIIPGLIFHSYYKYYYEYALKNKNEYIKKDPEIYAMIKSTSLHTVYNTIAITTLLIFVLIK